MIRLQIKMFFVCLMLSASAVCAEDWHQQLNSLGFAHVLQSNNDQQIQELVDDMNGHFKIWAGIDGKINIEEYLRVMGADTVASPDRVPEEERRTFIKNKFREVFQSNFDSSDSDSDGLLTREEFWQKSFNHMSEADRNRNGVLSVEEVRSHLKTTLSPVNEKIGEINKSTRELNKIGQDLSAMSNTLKDSTREVEVTMPRLNQGLETQNKETNEVVAKRLEGTNERSTLRLTACAVGFENAMHGEQPKDLQDKSWCEKRSVIGFLRAMGHHPEGLLPGEELETPRVSSYDLNKDDKITCKDFYLWKQWLAASFEKGLRKNNGLNITLKECP